MTDRITHACGLLRGTWISRPNGKLVADGYTVGSARRDPEIALCRDLVSEVPAWA